MRRKVLNGPLVMRLFPIAHCKNRPFYRIAITRLRCGLSDGFIEDLGSIDPLPNRHNEIIVGLNIERIKYYLSKPILIKGQVGPLLGLAGLLPVHPQTFKKSYLLREKLAKDAAEKENANKPEAAAAAATSE